MIFQRNRRCERKYCPRKATRWTRDIEEIETIRTPYRDGFLVKTTRQSGNVRRGCSWHPPSPSKYYPMEEV